MAQCCPGRLTEMALGIECLLTDILDNARSMALELDTLNWRWREIEAEMRQQVETVLQDLSPNPVELPPALCLFDAGWHPGG